MVEMFASGISGGSFSYETKGDRESGALSSSTGQILIVVDPGLGDNADYASRFGELLHILREAGQDRLPADRRYLCRERAEAEGIPVTPEIRSLLGET